MSTGNLQDPGLGPFNYYLNVLSNYATFTGRARRSEYWYFILFNALIEIAIRVALYITAGAVLSTVVYALYALGVMIPSLAVAIRRMHDTGRSGWYILIPLYNIVLLATDGVPGPNQYGADPKGRAAEPAAGSG